MAYVGFIWHCLRDNGKQGDLRKVRGGSMVVCRKDKNRGMREG